MTRLSPFEAKADKEEENTRIDDDIESLNTVNFNNKWRKEPMIFLSCAGACRAVERPKKFVGWWVGALIGWLVVGGLVGAWVCWLVDDCLCVGRWVDSLVCGR